MPGSKAGRQVPIVSGTPLVLVDAACRALRFGHLRSE